ncbi:ATPase component of the HslVU protease [Alphaproteobacteria bacterium]
MKRQKSAVSNLTPKEIVSELNRYVIGQEEAKRAVANALRNRWRRKLVTGNIRDEIVPHNILMIGPTGVGKTEIARRLARLTSSPFIKVEATKFTEVGYVGRDVDSIIRDLVEISIAQVREGMRQAVHIKAAVEAKKKLIDVIVGETANEETKMKFERMLNTGELDDKEVEISILDNSNSSMQTLDMPGGQLGVFNLGEVISKAFGGKKTKLLKLKVQEAYRQLLREESDKLLDEEYIIGQAIKGVEEDGIVFLDEVDKIVSRSGYASGRGEISREGVQRDLLPLIEGTIVSTKYGPVKTNHILFIASGAFHVAKPADLLPELQGRLPVRVELQPLSEEDMIRILKEPEHSLPKQYQALLAVENVTLEFAESGIVQIAKIAASMNTQVENIGARRLHTILEKLMEGVSFTASDTPNVTIVIDDNYVNSNLKKFVEAKHDMSRFIL